MFNAVFGDDFVALQNKIKEGFKTNGDPNTMVTALIDFTKESQSKGQQFEDLLNEFQKQLNQQGIKDVFGLADGKQTANSMRASIKAELTEATGTVLAGTFKGVQLNTQLIYDTNKRIELIAIQNVGYARKIEANTANTVGELKAVVVEMKTLNSKIKSADNAARAMGGI